MNVPKTHTELKQLIENRVEENISFEYKRNDALQNTDPKKLKIAKGVSAMANSAGGVIIYGVKEFDNPEKKHLPEAISPINRNDFSKEQLEQIINSSISPKIESLKIHPISLDNPEEVVYVVEIPQSNTAHQNTKDHRYYRRYNFESVPMLDYEIKDIMNRSKTPIIKLIFSIAEETIEVSNKVDFYPSPLSFVKINEKYITLKIVPLNIGSVLAKYVNYFVMIPEDIIKNKNEESTNGMFEIYGENVHRDIVGYTPGIGDYGGFPKYGSSRFDPILPGVKGISKSIEFIDSPLLDEREISWIIHADNASPSEGKIRLCDIKYNKIEHD